ncbi:hypothetical protein T484DRAFT_1891618, partial [Baffinella frigidus]
MRVNYNRFFERADLNNEAAYALSLSRSLARKQQQTFVRSSQQLSLCLTPDLDDVLSPKRPSKRPSNPSKAGGVALTLGGKIASPASGVWDRSKLQQKSWNDLRDVARGRGLTYSKMGTDLPRSDIGERILEAQTFAASLRAKHPSSCERGASERGGWWGFPGDYEVLESGDLEAEATFCGVPLTYCNVGTGNVETKTPETLCKALRKRRATYAPDLDDVPESTRPSKRLCHAGGQETCGWTGKLGALAEHLAQCRFAVTKCTLVGCSAKVQRKDVGAHEVECVWR